VQVLFSEPVQVTDPWFALNCSLSGNVSGSLTGGPTSYLLDPTSNLLPGDACTVSLSAANIQDQDGVAQSLGGSSSFSFHIAPDNAPSVSSTVPANNAQNVAVGANLSVTFSEPVTASSASFTLSCDSVSQAFALSNSGQVVYTLDPNTDFAANQSCVLGILGNQVLDIDGTPNPMSGNVDVSFVTSAGLSGYYQRVDPSTCRSLRATLHGVIDDHTSYPYSAGTLDTFDLVEIAEEDPSDNTRILDVYRNRRYLKGTDRSGGTGPNFFNREHTWPKSLGFPSETGDLGLPNAPHTDVHMLYASASDYNSTRGNFPYRNCTVQSSCNGEQGTDVNYGNGGGAGFPGQSNWNNGSSYHVWSKRQGDTARAVLYMDVRYEGGTHSRTGQSEPDLVLNYGSDAGTPGNLETLLAWHNADPPATPGSSNVLDNSEPLRNDRVAFYQGNRNPLIDHPEWAALLFAQNCTGPVVVAVDDDFRINQDNTLNASAPGLLRDDHNGSNKNGQGLTASIQSQPLHGTASITNATTGTFQYIPVAGYCGPDQFGYSVSNGSQSDQGIAFIDVVCTAPDTPPTAQADSFQVSEDSGSNTLTVLGNDSNADGGPLFIASTTQPLGGLVSIAPGGTQLNFVPNLNVCADTSFSYTLNGGSSATVNIDMLCVNDAPSRVGSLANQGVNALDPVSLQTAQAFIDVDGDLLSYSASGLPASLAIATDSGLISGTPTQQDAGVYSVSVIARDPSNAQVNQDFTLTVSALPASIFGNGFENP
jgi:endonuclease I